MGQKHGKLNKQNDFLEKSISVSVNLKLKWIWAISFGNKEKAAEPKDRLEIILHMSKFLIPTLKAVDVHAAPEFTPINIIIKESENGKTIESPEE